MRDMGIKRDAAERMVNGKGTVAEYLRFVQGAAADLTGGNRLPAEASRLQGARWSSDLWRFQTYPIVQARKLIRPAQRFFKAMKDGKKSDRDKAAWDFAKQLGMTTVSGTLVVPAIAIKVVGILLVMVAVIAPLETLTLTVGGAAPLNFAAALLASIYLVATSSSCAVLRFGSSVAAAAAASTAESAAS